MGICSGRDLNIDEVQSVIFHVRQIKKKEILMWDVKRARAWMLHRQWIFIEPPDTSKDNQIRMIIEHEDVFEKLSFQDVGNAITIVFGIRAKPEPRRQYINIGHRSYQKQKIHTIH